MSTVRARRVAALARPAVASALTAPQSAFHARWSRSRCRASHRWGLALSLRDLAQSSPCLEAIERSRRLAVRSCPKRRRDTARPGGSPSFCVRGLDSNPGRRIKRSGRRERSSEWQSDVVWRVATGDRAVEWRGGGRRLPCCFSRCRQTGRYDHAMPLAANERPSISVVIPTHNDAGRLGDALASIGQQTLAPIEIVVSDDASNDDTQAVVDNFASIQPVSLSAMSDARHSEVWSLRATTG